MNNKEFFKEVLKDEMPDIEKVRRECLNTELSKKPTVFHSILKAKVLVPAAACIILGFFVFCGVYANFNTDSWVDSLSGSHSETKTDTSSESKKDKNDKSEKNSKKNNNNSNDGDDNNDNNSNNENNSQSNQIDTQSYFIGKPNSITKISFNSIDDFKNLCKSCKYEGTTIYIEGEPSYILNISYDELAMLFVEKKIYLFNINGETLNSDGILGKSVFNQFTGCRFDVTYENENYELCYTTYKYTPDKENYIDEFTSSNGYTFKEINDSEYCFNVDDYYFYVKSSANKETIIKFLNDLQITSESNDL